jgi:3-dehydroquinate synthase
VTVRTVPVSLAGRGYDILIGPALIDRAGELSADLLASQRVLVVTDETVAPLYGARLIASFEKAGIAATTVTVPAGESSKEFAAFGRLMNALLDQRPDRKTTLVALGGGVVGDLTGFAAASLLRGVDFIQVPTTLLAQVDSSVGGKTGINTRHGKNLIGAFYQPRLVLADTDTLATLPARELAAGLAEVIKYGLILDRPFFDWLEANIDRLNTRDEQALTYAIRRSCEIKAAVVAGDERESAARALLNLGHTFGHAIEAGLAYGTWLHGEAVAAGTVLAARLSQAMGMLQAAEVARVTALLERARLPVKAPDLGVDKYLHLMGMDKKVEGGKMRLVLLRSIGTAYVTADFPQQALRGVLGAG